MNQIGQPLIIWDFDGTLAYREGGMWSATLACVVNEAQIVERTFLPEDFSPFLSKGFPWHEPEKPHTHIKNAAHWWAAMSDVLSDAIRSGAGLNNEHISTLLPTVRRVYTDASYWRVYPDVVECLECLSSKGWVHRILSNHVPELESLVESLGLKRHFEAVWSSAVYGYEKPHPLAFASALGNSPANLAWMIGDDIDADILGAAANNIRGVLVRKKSQKAILAIEDLTTLPNLIFAQNSYKPLSIDVFDY